jgi:hypothetical protein
MKKNLKKSIVCLLALSLVLVTFTGYTFSATDIDAEFVGHTIPSVMVRGETYEISITMKNVGAVHHWQQAYNIRLGNLEWEKKFDNYIEWTEGSAVDGTRVFLSAETDTTPIQIGENYTFTFSVKAPETGDSVVFAARMVQDGAYWLGDEIVETIRLRDAYAAIDSELVSHTVPTQMYRGQTYNVAVTMKNVGTVHHWQKAYNIRLGTTADNTIEWTEGSSDGGLRVYLSDATDTHYVTIGESYTFEFSVKAPETGDSTVFSAQMLQEGGAWLGDILNVNISLSDENVSSSDSSSESESSSVSDSSSESESSSVSDSSSESESDISDVDTSDSNVDDEASTEPGDGSAIAAIILLAAATMALLLAARKRKFNI